MEAEVSHTDGGKESNANIDCGNHTAEESETAIKGVEVNVCNTIPFDGDVNNCDKQESDSIKNTSREVFKKPILLIGPRKGKSAGKVQVYRSSDKPIVSCELSEEEQTNLTSDNVDSNSTPVNFEESTGGCSENSLKCSTESLCSSAQEIHNEKKVSNKIAAAKTSPAQLLKESLVPLPYKEPKWSGVPAESYKFEVLKNGSILETIDLSSKPFHVFGRLASCDVHMAHPTVSRYHAVLQFRSDSTEEPTGFYLYDLGSTHGTFLNKYRIKPNTYVRMRVGHLLKLGGSSRMFILQGPEEDMEQESELSVTELKQKRKEEEQARELLEIKHLEEERSKQEAIEKEGIDWGLGDDAEEEADLSENPFAATPNEELYLDDPKKTLRGWFEREGYDLEYKVEEKGYGQFLCCVELPVEHVKGGSLMAEVLVKGKKKESVVQCALEACRILDRYGLLRQANHESKKRKARNWEENDFYDSDEDTFLDRTGAVEKKRQQRMKAAGKLQAQTETYESLVKKHEDVIAEIQKLQSQLNEVTRKPDSRMENSGNEEEDALDAFMTNLSSEIPDKKLIGKLKAELSVLRQEEARLQKLVNLTCPATLPQLIKKSQAAATPGPAAEGKRPLLIGNRKKLYKIPVKLQGTEKTNASSIGGIEDDSKEEDEEEDKQEESQGHKPDEQETEDGTSKGVSEPTESVSSTSADESKESVEEQASENSDEMKTNSDERKAPAPAKKRIFGPTLPTQSLLAGLEEKRKKRNRHRGGKKGDVSTFIFGLGLTVGIFAWMQVITFWIYRERKQTGCANSLKLCLGGLFWGYHILHSSTYSCLPMFKPNIFQLSYFSQIF